MNSPLIYLASPYSDPDPAVRLARFAAVCRDAARLMAERHFIVSPIAHSHPIAVMGDLPTGWDFWERYDRALVAACGELWVLMLDGWDRSTGVKAEIDIARELGKPVRYVSPESLERSDAA